MLTQELLVEIHVLHRQGHSIRQIAKILRLSRNTVRRYLRDVAKTPTYHRPERTSKLESFKPYLLERINAAKPDWIPAAVLFHELQERGYQGKEGILKNWLRPYKTVTQEPVVRFETDIGSQLQIDFTTISRGRRKFKALVLQPWGIAERVSCALVNLSVRRSGCLALKRHCITSEVYPKSCCLIMPSAS